MESSRNPFTRDDTFFGVCQAIGEDFGFHPNWIRAAIAPLLMWQPMATVGGYVAVGLVVLVSRVASPDPRRRWRRKAAVAAPAPQPARQEVQGEFQLAEAA